MFEVILYVALFSWLAVFAFYFLAWVISISGIYYEEYFFMVKIMGFGFVKVRSGADQLKENLNKLRKTEDKTFFLFGPLWFSKIIGNSGDKK